MVKWVVNIVYEYFTALRVVNKLITYPLGYNSLLGEYR